MLPRSAHPTNLYAARITCAALVAITLLHLQMAAALWDETELPAPSTTVDALSPRATALIPDNVDESADAGVFTRRSHSLPVSNEAGLLIQQLDSALDEREYRRAVRVAERLFELPDTLVASRDGKVFYPAWRQTAALLDQLPPEGVALYRQLFDARVASRLTQVAARGDLVALRTLFEQQRLSAHWPAIGTELAAQSLDRGAWLDVVDTTSQMLSAGIDDSVMHAQRVVALTRLGRYEAAVRELDRLEQLTPAQHDAGTTHTAELVRAWFDAQRAPRRDVSAAWGMQRLLHAAVAWRCELSMPAGCRACPGYREIAHAISVLRRPPRYQGVLEAGMLVVRRFGALWGINADTLVTQWCAREALPSPTRGADAARR